MVAALLACALLGAAAPASAAPQYVTIDVPGQGTVDGSQPLFNNRVQGLRAVVMLPDGYDPTRRYPVLYLLHGISDDYRTWSDRRYGDAARVLGDLDAIVVMPEGGRGFFVDWYGRPGRAWARYHLDVLVPEIERRFPILPGREHHAIAGISMGGYGALALAARAPGYFGTAASISGIVDIRQMRTPALFDFWVRAPYTAMLGPMGGAFARAHELERLAPNLTNTRVLIAVSNGVVVPAARDPWWSMLALSNTERFLDDSAVTMTRSLRGRGVDVAFRRSSGIHDWWYWRRDLGWAARDWGLFGGRPDTPTQWTYATIDRTGAAWDLRYAFAERPRALVTLRRDGDRLDADGRGTMTITTPAGCAVVAELPARLTLPPGPC